MRFLDPRWWWPRDRKDLVIRVYIAATAFFNGWRAARADAGWLDDLHTWGAARRDAGGQLMAYLTATRYGLTRIEPTEAQRDAGWRQVWEHPSGMLAMRHPVTGDWVVSNGYEITEGFSSSLRAAARRIERMAL